MDLRELRRERERERCQTLLKPTVSFNMMKSWAVGVKQGCEGLLGAVDSCPTGRIKSHEALTRIAKLMAGDKIRGRWSG